MNSTNLIPELPLPSDLSRINPPPSPVNQPPKSTLPLVFVGIGIGVLLTAAAAYSYFKFAVKTDNSLTSQTNTVPSPTVAQSPTSTPSLLADSSGFRFQSPALVSNLPILAANTKPDESGFNLSQTKTYLIATSADGSKLYDVLIQPEGPSSEIIFRIVKNSTGYFYLTENFDQWIQTSLNDGKIFISSVKAYDKIISGLNYPDTISLSSGQLLNPMTYSLSGVNFKNDLKSPTKVEDTIYGEVVATYIPYQSLQNSNTVSNLYTRSFYLVLKDSYVVPLKPSYGFFSDEKTPNITWSDGTINKSAYTDALYTKCGAPMSSDVLKLSSVPTGAKVVGTTYALGKKVDVYQISDPQSALVKTFYDQYKTGRDYPSAPPIDPIDVYAAKKTHFLIQDSFGDWSIFLNQEFAPAVECGKPVIYLYPAKETQVNVAVDASITVSDPVYPLSGWQNVTARPDGSLTYQGKNYDSLFWEGQGHGLYPDLRQYGTVVAQDNLISTLKNQLTQLGLNQKESDDFLEFWQSRLPRTPYVRLAWLGTREMDVLAPLSVSPSPDTRIRIFLEFEGLQKPVKLIPQKLTAAERRGFTLVEWGGLLITNK